MQIKRNSDKLHYRQILTENLYFDLDILILTVDFNETKYIYENKLSKFF